ncbi:hypothetical protein IM697_12110 [Streptomyces ferrugineus]|uniref:Uncharacterized protein n=1 Tax=Streptomyces ferrugineus TaxID=1413221 RepID=A0A7M2SRR8_9ACTN|nr:hypothetical protein IM697_12110 [Streptomyces ferrugineus]
MLLAIHHCLGAPPASAETEIDLAAPLERFPELALVERGPTAGRSLRVCGLLVLQVS